MHRRHLREESERSAVLGRDREQREDRRRVSTTLFEDLQLLQPGDRCFVELSIDERPGPSLRTWYYKGVMGKATVQAFSLVGAQREFLPA